MAWSSKLLYDLWGPYIIKSASQIRITQQSPTLFLFYEVKREKLTTPLPTSDSLAPYPAHHFPLLMFLSLNSTAPTPQPPRSTDDPRNIYHHAYAMARLLSRKADQTPQSHLTADGIYWSDAPRRARSWCFSKGARRGFRAV